MAHMQPPLHSSIMSFRLFALVALFAWCATNKSNPSHCAVCLRRILRCIFIVHASAPGRGSGAAPVCTSVYAPTEAFVAPVSAVVSPAAVRSAAPAMFGGGKKSTPKTAVAPKGKAAPRAVKKVVKK
eukprot:scaffold23087_cov36-Phaeocystis_antarctica.AAC.1